jgi:hypothetical protein
MSLLPGTILPPSEPIGSVNQDGTVTIDKNWWLLFYNLSNQTLGNGNGVPADQLVDLESADVDAIDSDAVSLRLPISNALTQPPDVAPATSEYPDISRALLLAQDPPLQDVSPQAQPSATITVGGSPYSYTAPFNGCVVVTGGTVSAIAYVRQGTSIATGLTAGVFPVSRLDKVTVTYTGVPTMTFLPT